MNRRDFLRAAACGTGVLALPRPALPFSPAPIRITEAKFLQLRYPGKTPRKRNGTIASGGGAPGMTQLEIYTDAGIIGRSIAGG
ncbi:MAG TPA: twin-arginine translocation signal domain-containing protein, partial [Bryobacteraceae bacterium]